MLSLSWILGAALFVAAAPAADSRSLARTARSGAWSDPGTWEGGALPQAGARAQVVEGHVVVYDVDSAVPLRFVHVAGRLTFDPRRATRLEVGILKVGGEPVEIDSDCYAMQHSGVIPTLEIGTPEEPIHAGATATVRLTPFPGQNPNDAPELLSCGGRMELHGAPLDRSWVKLERTVDAGGREVQVAESIGGWRPGDKLVITTTSFPSFFTRREGGGRRIRAVLDGTETEEAVLSQVVGRRLTLAGPLQFVHEARGRYRGEVANLSRNLVVESADPNGVRGHTMYHHGSVGSISHAEFRHLGKRNVLARYPVHFHMVRDSMRGSSVTGADRNGDWRMSRGYTVGFRVALPVAP